jgi:hypothetical protein
MTHESEMSVFSSRSSPLLVTRRAFVTGALMTAAAPAAMAKLVATGGSSSEAITESVAGADVTPLVRQFHTTTESGLGTVVAGGFRFGPLSAVQIYDGQRWRNAPSMLRPRYQHAAVAFGQGILVMGGLTVGGAILADAEYFDGAAWTRVAPMLTPRSMAAAVIYNGFPMVTGGRRVAPLSSVEVFDGKSWQPYPSLVTPRFGHEAALVDGIPTVKGGAYVAPLSTSESFDGTAWFPRATASKSSL